MDLKHYFENTEGTGVIATADSGGSVDVAIYARPHVMDDGSIAFIMAERLIHQNLQLNPHAAYLFMEKTAGYKGVRLYLTKIREEKNSDLLFAIRRKSYDAAEAGKNLYLVFFTVDKVLPLVGDGF